MFFIIYKHYKQMGAIHINWIHLCYFTFFSFGESKEGT